MVYKRSPTLQVEDMRSIPLSSRKVREHSTGRRTIISNEGPESG
jgi:hypothetical protein